jgi:flagellar motor switch/type III secretory pathway protein FliN
MDNSDVLQRFADLPFPIEAELGNLTLTIGEIFDLREGMILQTDHAVGAPFTLRAGGAELAAVEVVVVGDALSVRVKNLAQKAKPGIGANGTN